MRLLYVLFNQLEEYKVPYCFQCQGKTGYYNLSITDKRGEQHSYSSSNIRDVEKFALMLWGHKMPSTGPIEPRRDNPLPPYNFVGNLPPLPPLSPR